MGFPRQRLLKDLPSNFCKNCAGRGFLLFERANKNGNIMPNEVIECGVCDGTGKRNANQAE
jgi:hypothetical protein